jgi:5-amino-6-(5-phosphoribosylamino)uracil reductase
MTTAGALFCKERQEFKLILTFEAPKAKVDIHAALQHLTTLGIKRLVVLGGGTCITSMLELDLIIDEFWLTICPLILGGSTARSTVEGSGFLFELPPRL